MWSLSTAEPKARHPPTLLRLEDDRIPLPSLMTSVIGAEADLDPLRKDSGSLCLKDAAGGASASAHQLETPESITMGANALDE